MDTELDLIEEEEIVVTRIITKIIVSSFLENKLLSFCNNLYFFQPKTIIVETTIIGLREVPVEAGIVEKFVIPHFARMIVGKNQMIDNNHNSEDVGMSLQSVTSITRYHCPVMNALNKNFLVQLILVLTLASTKIFPWKRRVQVFPVI